MNILGIIFPQVYMLDIFGEYARKVEIEGDFTAKNRYFSRFGDKYLS